MRLFSRPLPLAAVLVLAANDHALKGAGLVPAWLTGKLSDVAGLFFFPVLLVALAGEVHPRARARGPAALAVALTGVVFAALKLSPRACAWVTGAGLPTVADPSDLLALVSLPLAYVYMISFFRRAVTSPEEGGARAKGSWGERAGLVVAAIAAMATSQPPLPFTTWKLATTDLHAAGCARLDVWVSKSGKEGLGLSLTAQGPVGCPVSLERARVVVGEQSFAASGLPLALHADTATYVPFFFDNEALWNEGRRTGAVELEVVAGGERARVSVEMAHIWDDARRRGGPMPPHVPPRTMPLAVDPADASAPEIDAGSEGISL